MYSEPYNFNAGVQYKVTLNIDIAYGIWNPCPSMLLHCVIR